MNPALQATALQTFQLLVSFLSAYGVHRVLGGTAMVRRNGVRLGGAAASFFLVFYMLNHFLPDVRTQIVSDAMAAQRITVSTEAGVNQQELAPIRK